jgi:hypothetical protein
MRKGEIIPFYPRVQQRHSVKLLRFGTREWQLRRAEEGRCRRGGAPGACAATVAIRQAKVRAANAAPQ